MESRSPRHRRVFRKGLAAGLVATVAGGSLVAQSPSGNLETVAQQATTGAKQRALGAHAIASCEQADFMVAPCSINSDGVGMVADFLQRQSQAEQPSSGRQPLVELHRIASRYRKAHVVTKAAPTTSTVPVTTTTTLAPRVESPSAIVATSPPTAPIEVTSGVTPDNLLQRIGACESGGSVTAPIDYTISNEYGSSASGGWQIETATWANFMGYSQAKFAPPAVQLEKAEQLLAADGTAPWVSSESCWG